MSCSSADRGAYGRKHARSLGWRVLLVCLLAVGVFASSGCALFGPGPAGRVQNAANLEEEEDKREEFLELAWYPHPAMRPELDKVLRNQQDPCVRALATEALGRLGDDESVKLLRRTAREDPHWLVRSRALTWLCNIEGADARDEMAWTLKNDPDALVRSRATTLAARYLVDEEMHALLLDALEDPAGEVRMTACVELQDLTQQSYPPVRRPWQNFLQQDAGSNGSG